jgi:hypothetical protein
MRTDPFGLTTNIITRAQNVWQQTGRSEKWWILTTPVREVAIVRKGRAAAISAVNKKYGGHEDGTVSNAYLHAYWSAYITREGGIMLAKEYTDLHEAGRGQSLEYGSYGRMDLYNNLIGRALATAAFAKEMTISELLEYAVAHNLLATHPRDPKLKKFDVDRWFNECK